MDKRYQVFISSTYLDLREERQAVSQALLRSDCFPAQMENWPAMDAEQMEAIKQIIDESDYYLVISAGKYGSISPETGLSYTEMEYDYAVEIGKPIIRLLHKDPFNALRGDQIESEAKTRKKLEAFRGKLETGRVRAIWENADQLKNETILGLLDIKKRKPRAGWVKGENALTPELLKELDHLRKFKRNPIIKKSKPEKINFRELEGKSDVELLVQDNADDVKPQSKGIASVPNWSIAEHVFLALLEDEGLAAITWSSSEALGRDFIFSDSLRKFAHYWLTIPSDVVRNCLHYLETRGLVAFKKGGSFVAEDLWKLTAKGRLGAMDLIVHKNFK